MVLEMNAQPGLQIQLANMKDLGAVLIELTIWKYGTQSTELRLLKPYLPDVLPTEPL